jgi:hypothetical protein
MLFSLPVQGYSKALSEIWSPTNHSFRFLRTPHLSKLPVNMLQIVGKQDAYHLVPFTPELHVMSNEEVVVQWWLQL